MPQLVRIVADRARAVVPHAYQKVVKAELSISLAVLAGLIVTRFAMRRTNLQTLQTLLRPLQSQFSTRTFLTLRVLRQEVAVVNHFFLDFRFEALYI